MTIKHNWSKRREQGDHLQRGADYFDNEGTNQGSKPKDIDIILGFTRSAQGFTNIG